MCIRMSLLCVVVSAVAGCSGESVETAIGNAVAETSPTTEISQAPAVTASIPSTINSVADGETATTRPLVANVDPVRQKLDEIQLLRTGGGENDNQIVLASLEVLKQTKDDPARESQFLEAIRHLLQARLQQALSGGQAEVDQLYADVEALDKRDPQSEAAAEGIFYLARFAHTKARQPGQNRTDFYMSFSRWAREFATRFPQQQERAISLLFGAGRSCEMSAAAASDQDESAQLRSESKLCYHMLQSGWPKSSQGQEAASVLRRFSLPGRKLSQFSGPTLGGSAVRADQFGGRMTLIYFWDSESREFSDEWLPLLQRVSEQLGPKRIQLVGVNLDDDVSICRETVESRQVPGSQICFPDTDETGWNSPLIRFWGVSQSPGAWLLDRKGVVDAVDMSQDQIVPRIKALLRAAKAQQ